MRSVLLLIPGHWDAEPEGLRELRRFLSDEYGAMLEVRPTKHSFPLILCGPWDGPQPTDDLAAAVGRAFFTLDWLDEVL